MTQAAPTILALETDSAWIVILAVSLVTLPAAIILRRLIGRPGGILSGVLLSLPLLLPVVAAIVHGGALLPELAVLQPAKQALVDGSKGLMHLLYVSDGRGRGTFYALIGSAGPWILFIGLSVSSIMLLRRVVGTYLLHRLVARCRPLTGRRAAQIHETVRRLSESFGLRRPPEVSLLPDGVSGAFAVGAVRARILISENLIDALDDDELAAILAHEVSHIESRDVQIVFMAGLLRDAIAWNPLAHLAWRRLTSDREYEADRRAAAVTGEPLAVASGLLKMYEIVRRRRRHTPALAFLRPGGRIVRRVAHLLDVADGRVVVSGPSRLPYALAALLVAALGLQAGARIAADRAALAIVWGAPGETGDLYSPKRVQPAPSAGARRKGEEDRRLEAERPQTNFALRSFSSIQEKNIDEWVKDMTRWTHRRGDQRLSPITLRWEARQDWLAEPLQCTVGSLCIYRMTRGTLVP